MTAASETAKLVVSHDERRTTTRESLFLMANTVGTAVLGVAYWGIAARGISVSIVGVGTALIAAVTTISNLSQLNFYNSMGVLIPRARMSRAKLVARIYSLTTGLTVTAVTIFLIVGPLLNQRLQIGNASGGAAVAIAAVLWSVFALEDGALIAVRSARVVAASNVAYGIAKVAVLIVALQLAPGIAVPLSWYGPLVLIVPIVNWRLFQLLRKGATPSDVSNGPPASRSAAVGRFVAVDYLGYLLLQSATTALPVFVSAVKGPEPAAVFGACWMISSTVDLIGSNVAMSMTVGIAGNPKIAIGTLRTTLPGLLGGVGAVAAILFAAAPWALRYFGPVYAQHGVAVVRILLVGCVFRLVVTVCCAVARALMRPGTIVIVQAIIGAVVLGAGVPAMAGGGLVELGLAWVIAQIVAAFTAGAMTLVNVRQDSK